MRDGVWLHAVARDLEPGAVDGLVGVAGGAVRTVGAGALTAAVCPVDLAEFGEEALRRNLEDLAWLDRAARAHHAVVAALAREHAVVPARLATVYHDDAGVLEMLRQRHDELEAVLDRVGGRAEWGVKMYAEPPTSQAGEPTGPSAGRPGTAYLERRRARLAADDVWRQRAAEGAEATHLALAADAAAARRHPPQDHRLTGRAETMVLNGAYLVDRGRAGPFADLVAAQAARHAELSLELTGPWPPYSFTGTEPAPP
ncbi:GvpL/GvpF family gas vesicle protein [Dactylosporangium sp. CA-139114]|uniref:GvpL/GvpF family gas vesicle protein n=1 Tax=Dactylosporangium sp. CA-139114 TaxID=3239931 RepID=UPI003D95715B